MDEKTRAFIERQRELGKSQELPSDVEPYGESRASWIAVMNERRKKHGLPVFENDEVGNPELTERRRLANERYIRGLAQERP